MGVNSQHHSKKQMALSNGSFLGSLIKGLYTRQGEVQHFGTREERSYLSPSLRGHRRVREERRGQGKMSSLRGWWVPKVL